MKEADSSPATRRLVREVKADLGQLSRAMNEAVALRDGEAWVFETIRLDQLAVAAAELYEPLAEARGITIVAQVEPVSVLGVSTLLQRAMTNLVDNAVKYSPDAGTVTVTVATVGGRPVMTVADQGRGFDEGALNNVARQVAAAVAEGRESHGMGLAFVRAILRRHGAVMTIDDAAPGAVVRAEFSR